MQKYSTGQTGNWLDRWSNKAITNLNRYNQVLINGKGTLIRSLIRTNKESDSNY